MLGHITSLQKFKKIEIISSIFSNHNSMWLEINHENKNCRNTNTWMLNNVLLKNQWVTGEIKKEIKKEIPADKWKWKYSDPKIYEMQQMQF